MEPDYFFSCLLSCVELAEHSLGIQTFQLAKKHVDKIITVRYGPTRNLTISPVQVFGFKRSNPTF